jgi:integrase
MKKRGRPKETTKAGLKYLDEGQLKAFFQATRKTRDDLIFSLIVFYGLRVCELARLRMADVDHQGRQLRVTAAKGGLARTEEIAADIWTKLEAWLKKWEKSDYLFPGRLPGRPMSIDRLKALFKEVAGRAGPPKDFSIHSLRHTTAIMMAARGASPIRIKTWLRHKRISSSERYFEQVRFQTRGRKWR